MKNFKPFKNYNWIKHWAGYWSILSCTYYGYQYTKLLEEALGISFALSMFISKKGYSVCSLEKNDYNKFGEELAKRVVDNEDIALGWCKELKNETDKILKIIKELEIKGISTDDFKRFMNAFYEYSTPHRAVKVSVDFLPKEILDKLLPKLSEARLYAEPVYAETERFTRIYAKQLSKKFNTPPELILSMNKDEFDIFLENKTVPNRELLEDRYKATAILYEKGEFEMVTGEKIKELEDEIAKRLSKAEIIKGTTAYPGQAKGRVKIIFDTKKEYEFNEGDILVTGMTRPEYVKYISKASAFITDAGGMLSHAAITARELKKPCIVGAEIATKVLKNGDMVEIDAERGEIKKLDKKYA